MLTAVHYEYIGGESQEIVVARGSPNSLRKLDRFLTDNYGVITRLEICQEEAAESLERVFVVSQHPVQDAEDLRTLINRLSESPQPLEPIESQSLRQTDLASLLIFQQTDSNMQIDYLNWESHLSLLFCPQTFLENLLLPQQETKELSVQQPQERELPARRVPSVQSIRDPILSGSQLTVASIGCSTEYFTRGETRNASRNAVSEHVEGDPRQSEEA